MRVISIREKEVMHAGFTRDFLLSKGNIIAEKSDFSLCRDM